MPNLSKLSLHTSVDWTSYGNIEKENGTYVTKCMIVNILFSASHGNYLLTASFDKTLKVKLLARFIHEQLSCVIISVI